MTIQCETIIVTEPPPPAQPNITATSMTISPTGSCPASCRITLQITWQNNGAGAGTFSPSFTINDGLPIAMGAQATLQPGESVTRSTLIDANVGTYTFCPNPN